MTALRQRPGPGGDILRRKKEGPVRPPRRARLNLNKLLHPVYLYPLAGIELLRTLTRVPGWLALGHEPRREFSIPGDFFGVNLAPGDDPAMDDYCCERLRELGLRDLRMDFSYGSPDGPAERLLEKLLGQGFRVLLDVLPPLAEAEVLHRDVEAQRRWREFLLTVFTRYSGRVHCFEIGNTPNRGRWSGFSSRSFLVAWDIAGDVAADFDVTLAGPNVSDFEPLFNAGLLQFLERLDRAPAIHTDNLFVERVVEPDAYDHRVFGRWATNLLKLNLIKKARVLEKIGRDHACQQLVCTYTCWTSKRLARRSPWPAQKGADYMLRYLALAASSGALSRVYWGPLVCSRDGLIDDWSPDYPAIDQVSHYERVRGQLEDLHITSSFHSLQFAVRWLAGTRCIRAWHQARHFTRFDFESDTGRFFSLCWTRDGAAWPLEDLFNPGELQQATFYDPDGEEISQPAVISERPLLIHFRAAPRGDKPPSPSPAYLAIRHLSSPGWQSTPLQPATMLGAAMLRRDHQLEDREHAVQLTPERIRQLPETAVLRDARNRLWNVTDPRDGRGTLTVKLNRVKGIKRLTYRFRPSKGRRHWNNGCLMLARGVTTPRPVAFFESTHRPGISDSWYLCEFIPGAFSSRDIYAAFRDGAEQYRGMTKLAWFQLLSCFVCNMHDKQIVHRDLSAGNLLLHETAPGVFEAMVIDIGRAWIWTGPGSRVGDSRRLVDLIRLCYKLDWRDRALFMECYEAHRGRAFPPYWRLPFIYYDSKQGLKKTLKGKKRARPR